MFLRPYQKLLGLIFFLFSTVNFLFGQDQVVSGVVNDQETGDPLIGVSIVVQGTATGTITDATGNYRIDLSEFSEPVLVYTYIGYKEEQVPVNGRSTINLEMTPDVTELGEVVVTAFGIKKEKKAINYAIQNVQSKDLVESQQENIVNALNGKVAGVQVTNTSGSPGASSQILIRGANSVSAEVNNQPLFIVDGLPIDNSASFGGGNRAMDINPNDIENISILKGPAAAALYGLEAANGAVIITTKSGAAGKTTVNFGATVSADQAFKLPPRQEMYMQGTQGVFDPEVTSSYGPLLLPTDPKFDNTANFLETGIKQKYDLSISTGSEKSSLYVSGNYLDQQGIFPEEAFTRYGLLIKGESKLNDKVTVDASANLVNSVNTRSGNGSMYNIYRWPLNDDMANYLNPDGSKRWLIDRNPGDEWNNPENPYWRSINNPREDDVDRIIALGSVNWNIIEPLNFTYRLGTDLTNQHYSSITSPGSAGSVQSYKGTLFENERFYRKTNSTILLTYDQTFGGFAFSALGGNNIQIEEARSTSLNGRTYKNPGLDNINNMEDMEATQSLMRKRLVGLYGELKLDYQNIAYISVTGRNDWSSTLPKANNSFFYPSFSGGLVFTELTGVGSFLTYGKIRGNWAEVGKDAPPHRLTAVLEPFQAIGGGFKYDYYAGNPNLKPETTRSWEIGADLRFLNGRARLDATYYDMLTIDQIVQSRISTASGWVMLVFNSGSIENKGVELFMEYDVFDSENFNWNVAANYSFNNSELVELPSFVSKYPVTQGQVVSAARPSSVLGFPLMAVEGTDYLYNENGQLVVDEDGFPRIGNYVKDAEGNYVYNDDGTRKVDNQSVYLGNREPDAIIGVTNSLEYKNFNLSFLFDFRLGGKVLNATKVSMIANGTAGYLEDYRNKNVTFNGVVEQENGNFVPNAQEVFLDQGYFINNYASVGSNFVEDASWTRLRYVTLSYRFPKSFSQQLGMRNLNLSLTGRNLLLLTKYSGGDPETNYGGSGVGGTGTIGLDYFNVPSTQGIDFTIKATF